MGRVNPQNSRGADAARSSGFVLLLPIRTEDIAVIGSASEEPGVATDSLGYETNAAVAHAGVDSAGMRRSRPAAANAEKSSPRVFLGSIRVAILRVWCDQGYVSRSPIVETAAIGVVVGVRLGLETIVIPPPQVRLQTTVRGGAHGIGFGEEDGVRRAVRNGGRVIGIALPIGQENHAVEDITPHGSPAALKAAAPGRITRTLVGFDQFFQVAALGFREDTALGIIAVAVGEGASIEHILLLDVGQEIEEATTIRTGAPRRGRSSDDRITA